MEEVILKIENYKIKAFKTINTILTDKGIKEEKLLEKIIYTIPLNLEIYKKIPTIVKINNKMFYKTDVNKIDQKDFKLIEC